MVLQFERTATGSIHVSYPIAKEDAQELIAMMLKSGILRCKFSCDNFMWDMEEAPIPNDINLRCFCGPFQWDRDSIDVCDCAVGSDAVGRIAFEVTQQCLFFANGMDTDETDTAITMANVAAVADDVFPLTTTSSDNHLKVVAPKGIPHSQVVSCIGKYARFIIPAEKES